MRGQTDRIGAIAGGAGLQPRASGHASRVSVSVASQAGPKMAATA